MALFGKTKNNPGKNIPQDLIAPEDIEKHLMRGSLLGAHKDVVSKYEKYIAPLAIPFSTNQQRNLEEEKLFAQFVKELNENKAKYTKFYEDKGTVLEIAKIHKADAVSIATRSCDQADAKGLSEHIFPQLRTISANVQSRTCVLDYQQNQSVYTHRRNYGTNK